MTNRQGLSQDPQNSNNSPDSSYSGSIPNSVARSSVRNNMGSHISLSRRGNSSSNANNEQRNERNTIYNQRYSRRSFNILNPIRNRSSSSSHPQAGREAMQPVPPRRSARINSRLSEHRRTPSAIPTPPPLPPPREHTNIRESSNFVAMSFASTSSYTNNDISDSRPSSTISYTTPYSDPMESSDHSPLRQSLLEIVRVMPHRLIQIPPMREPTPQPPSAPRPPSRGAMLLQRARRLLRDNSNDESSNSLSNNNDLPSRSANMTPPIRRTPETSRETAGTSDPDLNRATFLRAESELISGMLNSAAGSDRLSRLRLLRLRQNQEEDASQRDRIISGILGREPPETSDSGETAPLTRLRMLQIPGQGAILMEDVRPEASLRMSLVQAQYLQEVLLRISSLLDNLHILSQMHDRIEGNPELTTRIQSLQDDPRLQTFLAIATLDPDNMTYEQLLMLDDLLPKNQGATKETIATKTSLLQYVKSDIHENDSCIVCITDFEENEGIRLLPCCHIYHIQCIDTWLKKKKTCPMCRSSIEDKPSQVYVNRMDKFRDFKK